MYLRAKPLTLPTRVFPGLKPGFQTREPYPKTQSDVDSSILSCDFSNSYLPFMFSCPILDV